MNHPELFAVPVLMLADYVLTIWGAKSSAIVYRSHFSTPSYELNPLWRKSVDELRWFNPRHAALVVLVTVGLVFFDLADMEPDSVVELPLGLLFGAFGSVCGRHLGNLLLFRYLNRHPDQISGQVQLSMKLVLKMSQFTLVGMILPFVILAILVPSAYSIGMLLGVLVIFFAHFFWGRKAESAAAPR